MQSLLNENNIRLGIADPSPMDQELLVHYLQQIPGFKVLFTVRTWAELQGALEYNCPGFLLLNINLQINHFLNKLKSISLEHKELRIIILAEKVDEPFIKNMISHGASSIVTRDRNLNLLLDVIRNLKDEKVCLPPNVTSIYFSKGKNEREETAENEIHLTRLEKEIIRCMKIGLTSKEIALKHNVTRCSIDSAKTRIKKKFNCKNSVELMVVAAQSGII